MITRGHLVTEFRSCGRTGNLNSVMICFVCVYFVLSVAIVLTNVMNQSSSKSWSLLYYMMDNISDFRKWVSGFGFQLKPSKLCILCELTRISFSGINWPSEGSFNFNFAYSFHRVCNNEHLDQLPYIVTWVDLLDTSPSWVKKCHPPQL